MKNFGTFSLGFISGIAFLYAVAYFQSEQTEQTEQVEPTEQVEQPKPTKKTLDGMTLFDQPGGCVSTNRFEVSQVLDDNYALAYELEYKEGLGYWHTDLLVLITNDNNEYYYDKQTIKVPKGKCMRQVGIYKYKTTLSGQKTVPIVKLMNK